MNGAESVLQQAMQAPPRYPTILAARSNVDRPTELEVCLRSHCRKLKVVPSLPTGAHLLIPGINTLALRVYYAADLDRFPEPPPERVLQELHDRGGANENKETPLDLDGLKAFSQKNGASVTFFVLSPDILQKSLTDPCSFPRRVMRLLQPSYNGDSQCPQSTHIMFVHTTAQAIDSILAMTELGTPEKKKLQQGYLNKQRIRCFVPPQNLTTATPPEQQLMEQAASRHVATAMREWGDRQNIPTGEADLLMRIFESLQSMVMADESCLAQAPVHNHTKRQWLALLSGENIDAEGDPEAPSNDYGEYTGGSEQFSPSNAHPQSFQNSHYMGEAPPQYSSEGYPAHHPQNSYAAYEQQHPVYTPPPPQAVMGGPQYAEQAPPPPMRSYDGPFTPAASTYHDHARRGLSPSFPAGSGNLFQRFSGESRYHRDPRG